jgi:hypothetical protein
MGRRPVRWQWHVACSCSVARSSTITPTDQLPSDMTPGVRPMTAKLRSSSATLPCALVDVECEGEDESPGGSRQVAEARTWKSQVHVSRNHRTPATLCSLPRSPWLASSRRGTRLV